MSPNTSSNSKDYFLACTYLAKDLVQAISDLDFVSDPENRISYAVDFSELYEYILPSEAYQDFVVFPKAFNKPNNDEIAAKAIQQLILRYILIGRDHEQIVLLPPYLLEFKNFINKYSSELFIELIKKANLLYKRFQIITSNHINDKILSICQKTQTSTLSKKEVDILTHFIENFGQYQSIIEHIDSQNSPWQRLKQLDPQNSFRKIELSSLNVGKGNNADVYERWVKELGGLRQTESITANKLDAAAIQYLYNVNRSWPEKHRLILITRSKHMHSIYSREIEKGLWKATGDHYLLRHPRVFSLVMPAELSNNPYNRNYLAHLLEIVNNFLLKYESCCQEDRYFEENLQKDIHEIEDQWQRIQQFAITLGSSQLKPTEVTQSLAEQARIIMEGVRKLIEKGKLIKHLDTMVNELENIHKFLEVSPQELPEDISYSENEIQGVNLKAPLSIPFLPYELYLESVDLREKVESTLSGKNTTSQQCFSFLHQYADNEGCESLLAQSYILGVLGMWPVAEKCCRTALAQEYPSENLLNECKFFLAICLIQQHGSMQRLLEAYQLLNDIPNKLEITHYSRYQIELGIVLLKIYRKKTNFENNIASAITGLFILNTEQNEIQSNVSLWLNVIKAKLDYFYSQGDNKNIMNLKREAEESEKALKLLEPNSDNWPPSIVDSVAWVKWLLFSDEFTMQQEHQAILDLLQKALDKTPPDLELHHEIDFHIKEIQKKIKSVPEK